MSTLPQSQAPLEEASDLALFDDLPVAVISDAIDKLGLPNTVLDPAIHRLAGRHLVGRARTVHRAKAPTNAGQAEINPKMGAGTQDLIDSCAPGDVVVVAAHDDVDFAVWGGNMGVRAAMLGVRGLVTDGAMRDLDEMDELGLSVFAKATTPRQAFKRMVTFDIDVPVFCGGVLIRPGDILVGDGDGVVAVPAAEAARIAAAAREIIAGESQMQDFIRAGNSLGSAVARFKLR
jgi:regulator of RNase E activity RraA